MSDLKISMDDVKLAQKNIGHVARKTPLNLGVGKRLRDKNIHIKLENLQLTGSFKIRGSLNKISQLTKEEKARGVIAASAGNHAQGVAMSSQLIGVKSKIVMPTAAPLIKVTATKSYGAEVVLHGRYFDEAFAKAEELAKKENLVFVHPYKDKSIIAGQATIALEILESLPDLKSIVVPIGGGGLISGISFVVKQINPQCKVYGVVSDQTPGMMELKTGKTIAKPSFISTIADGIAIKNPSQEMYDTYINKYVDEIVSVNDEDIAQAIVYGMEVEKTILEGSGAAGLAAVLNGKIDLEGPSCIVLCGGNIDLNTIVSVIDTGLRKNGRLARISVIVNDLPGELASLTQLFAESRANVLDVIHDRVSPELSLRQTRIDFLLETMSFEHIQEILEKIRKKQIWLLER
jgi:threonine dehydratase